MKNKEVLMAYLEVVVEDLSNWVDKANRLLVDDSSKLIASVVRFTTYKLRNINTSIDDIKSRVHNLYLAYKDLEEEYELATFSVQYFLAFAKITEELAVLTTAIASVGNSYSVLIEEGKEQNLKIDDYITPLNQKRIEFLKGIKDNDLLEILEKGNLAGL